ncbi:MAG TPA: ABC transporter permease [Candidatus Lokiarchaeia archaeon]|nr:ABC transporter permease [Candidatus Lokiarchaeia archaeon]
METEEENKILDVLKFIFWPRYRLERLVKQKDEMEQFESKRGFFKRMNAPLTIVGMVIIFTVFFIAIFAPWLTPYTDSQLRGIMGPYYQKPSLDHLLGTTVFGEDVLGRIIWGARTSLSIGFTSLMIALIGGIIVGLTAAYFGGAYDNIMMRIMDILLAFPELVLALVIIGVFPQTVTNYRLTAILIAFGVLSIPIYARLLRGSVLSVKQNQYVEAAKVGGASDIRIMFRHIMVNCLSPIIVNFSFDVGGIILSLAGISFLGFGDPSMIEWGNDLSVARSNILTAWWAVTFPGLAILFTVFGFMLLGDGLRDALDPRLKNL